MKRELVEDFTEHFLEKNPAALKLKNILGPQERRHLHQSNPQFHFEVQKKENMPFMCHFAVCFQCYISLSTLEQSGGGRRHSPLNNLSLIPSGHF